MSEEVFRDKKRGLGRGLESLLGESPTAPLQIPKEDQILHIPLERLRPDPNQPRKTFPKESLEELSCSMKDRGILQPLVVRPLRGEKGTYQILAGERRWRAAQRAGLLRVPVILKEATPQESLEWALIENIQREDLNAFEEAQAYKVLMEEHHLSQKELALRLGKQRVTVTNTLRLLALPPSVQELLKKNLLSQGQAKVLLSFETPALQKKWALRAAGGKMTVRALERALKNTPSKELPKKTEANSFLIPIQEELQHQLNTKVSISYNKGKGHVTLHFYSNEQLSQIVEQLRKR